MSPLPKALSAAAPVVSLLARSSPRGSFAATASANRCAYQPVRAVQRPADASWSSHPIDRFIFAELKKRGLRPIHERGVNPGLIHGVIEDSRRTCCASDVFGNVVRDVVV